MRRVWVILATAIGVAFGVLAAPILGAQGTGPEQRAAVAREAPAPRAHGPQSDLKFVPIDPVRAFDSRVAAYAASGILAPNASKVVSVKDGHDFFGNVTTADAVPAHALAVAYNITITGPTGPNFVSVTPGDATSLTTSAINFNGTSDLANAGIVNIDSARQLKVWNGIESGSTHIIIDITGYFVEPMFAVVSSGGSIIEAARVDSVTRDATGEYTVDFDEPVVDCAFAATLELSSPGFITAVLNTSDTVTVRSFDAASTPTDSPFDLIATC